ncbi:MAG: sigma factor-like helix-turn-helix DNA-binding protein [Chitinophagaceae bacterium]
MPNNQKTAIILTKIDGRPQQEVAEIMNMSVKAIESLLQRAKNNIANKLTQSEG